MTSDNSLTHKVQRAKAANLPPLVCFLTHQWHCRGRKSTQGDLNRHKWTHKNIKVNIVCFFSLNASKAQKDMKTDSIKSTCMQNLPQQMKTPTHLSESLSWQRRGAVQSHRALFKNSFWVEKSWRKKKVENCSVILNAPLGVSSFTWPRQQQPASSKATLDTLHTHRETLIHTHPCSGSHTHPAGGWWWCDW